MDRPEKRTAARRLSLLYTVAGVLAIVNPLMLSEEMDWRNMVTLGFVIIATGLVALRLPWEDWPDRAILVMVPVALAYIVIAEAFGGIPSYLYPVYFILTFTWLGLSQPPLTSLMVAPLAAIAYVYPLLGPRHPPLALHTAPSGVLVCVLVGETVSWAVSGMRRARQEALEASRLKSEFLATMSHEIRTPLNAVIGMLGLLEETELDERQGELASVAHASADALLSIINDLLDFTRIEAGGLAIEAGPFHLGRLVCETVSMFRPAARNKELKLRSRLGEGVAGTYQGDAGRLRQVLLNLVGNAVKFTAAGEVALHVTLADAGADPPRVRFEVIDTGIGIAADRTESVFDHFVQADASITRRYGGSGLGLAISKRLVAMMGGTIGVTSRVGQGSTFWFELPLPREAAAEEALSEAEEPDALQPLISARVLVVDDNPSNLRVAQLQLESLGCRADLAAGGHEAVQMASLVPYDLILMDCHMPDMDGFAAAESIRARNPARRIPIVAVTAGAAGEREQCLAAGMHGYLAKPLRMESLRQALVQWTAAAPSEYVNVAVPHDEHLLLDPSQTDMLRDLVRAGGGGSFEVLVRTFDEGVARGLKALQEALAAGDTTALQRKAHELTGSCLTMGLRFAADLCKGLETGTLERAAQLIPRLEEAITLSRLAQAAALGMPDAEG